MTTDTPRTLPDGRAIPLMTGAERPMLESWLAFHRATLAVKCAGLDDTQVRLAAAEPSSLTLLGLVQHLAEVERTWFQRVFGLDVPTVYDSEDGYALEPGRGIEEALAVWRREIARTGALRRAVARRPRADPRRADGRGRGQSALGADSSGRGVRPAQRSRRYSAGKHRRIDRGLIRM
jgi:hypothetical protein